MPRGPVSVVTSPGKSSDVAAWRSMPSVICRSARLCVTGGVLATTLAAQDYPPAFPRTNVTAIFKSDSVMVWDVMWPNGQPTALHRHVYDQVGTYYSPGGRVITELNGTKREATTPIGALSNTRAGTTHIEEGTTDPPLRAVFIELRGKGAAERPAPSDVPPMFPRERTIERLDDERVTVWDHTWQAVEAVEGWYERETIWIFLSDGVLDFHGGNSAPYRLAVTPGRIRHRLPGTLESVTVVSGNPRAMIVAVK